MSEVTSHIAAASLVVALACSAAGPAAAQSFLKSLAREAAQRAAAAAVSNAANQDRPSDADRGAASAPTEEAEVADTSTSGPAPWPVNAGSAKVKDLGDLKFSAELEQQKKDFVEWSKVRCSDCEGGYHYDAWAQHFISTDGSWHAWEKKLAALAMGESLTWKGGKANGAITVVGETPVKGWSCRQLEWSLTRGSEKVTRPGLICMTHSSSGAEIWNTVF